MKKLFVSLGAIALFAAPALAADLPAYTKAPAAVVSPIYNWSGFYIGLNGGGGWSHKCWDERSANVLGVTVTFNPALVEGCHDATGGVIGGQMGYRWMAGAWVFGLEAQGDWANLTGSNESLLAPGRASNRTKIDALGLFTGQVGYAFNNVLWYVKGGAAVANDKYEGFATTTNLVVDRGSETRWGAVIGTGLEFGITPNLSLAIEYDHVFMGNRDVTFTAVPVAFFTRTDRISQDVDMVTARINYRFGGPVVAKY